MPKLSEAPEVEIHAAFEEAGAAHESKALDTCARRLVQDEQRLLKGLAAI
jgi:hypothetical protein